VENRSSSRRGVRGTANPARWASLHCALPLHREKPGADFGLPPGRFLAWLAPDDLRRRRLDRHGPQAARPASAALQEIRKNGPARGGAPASPAASERSSAPRLMPRPSVSGRTPRRACAVEGWRPLRRRTVPKRHSQATLPRARGRRAIAQAATLASSPGSTSSPSVERAEGGSGAPEQTSASVSSSSAARSSWESSSAERTRSRP
jgi:hypothetical protein